jgi:RNase H-fold protein (predicted Holliday junction resolvase)
MNRDKAREFFSAYYEGSLDGGLRQTLENRLQSDDTLQAEYHAFQETMRMLEGLRHEEIELPIYLSDRIATRIEGAQQAKSGRSLGAWGWLRGLAFAGLATAAILGAVVSIVPRSSLGNFANVVPSMPWNASPAVEANGSGVERDRVSFTVQGPDVVINYRPSVPTTVVVRSADTGDELNRFALKTEVLRSPLQNNRDFAALFSVAVEGQGTETIVAVPGKSRSAERSGQGTIKDFARVIADVYNVPVLIQANDVRRPIAWSLSGTDALAATRAAVGSQGYNVDRLQTDIILLQDR